MKTIRKFFTTMMTLALALMTSIPMQAKAAEVQPTTIPLVKDGYYQEVEKDGVFNQHDDEGNLISSIKVEDALFKVNATLTEGWGKATISESHVEGTFKDATLDTKGYFRCSFTTEDGVVYDDVVVKVTATTWKKWDATNRAKAAAIAAAESAKSSAVGQPSGGQPSGGQSSGGKKSSGDDKSKGDEDPGFPGIEEEPDDDVSDEDVPDEDPGNTGIVE